MHGPNQIIAMPDPGFAGAEADDLLLQRNDFFYRAGVELAPRETIDCHHQVAVERQRRLVCGNGLLPSVLRAQHLAFDEVRKCVAGQCYQCLANQRLRTRKVAAAESLIPFSTRLTSVPARRVCASTD